MLAKCARHWFPLAILASLLLVVPDMRAQESVSLADASLEDLMNVKVSTASKYLQFAKEAPAFATVITREEIQRYGYRTLADALQNVGGFFITYDRFNSRSWNSGSVEHRQAALRQDGRTLRLNLRYAWGARR